MSATSGSHSAHVGINEDRRRVTVEVAWVPTIGVDLQTHHWQAQVFVGDERVSAVRCYARETAVEEALGSLAAAGIWVDIDDD